LGLVNHLRKNARKVTCPALIMHSKEDSWTTPWNAEELLNWLGSKDKEIHWLTGCDHVMTIDLKKREVASRLGEFVEKVSWLHAERAPNLDRDRNNFKSEKMAFGSDQKHSHKETLAQIS
jgi:hypothetical protein